MKPGEIYWVDLATGRRPGIGDVIDSDCEPN